MSNALDRQPARVAGRGSCAQLLVWSPRHPDHCRPFVPCYQTKEHLGGDTDPLSLVSRQESALLPPAQFLRADEGVEVEAAVHCLAHEPPPFDQEQARSIAVPAVEQAPNELDLGICPAGDEGHYRDQGSKRPRKGGECLWSAWNGEATVEAVA